jgi:hypothetical protein
MLGIIFDLLSMMTIYNVYNLYYYAIYYMYLFLQHFHLATFISTIYYYIMHTFLHTFNIFNEKMWWQYSRRTIRKRTRFKNYYYCGIIRQETSEGCQMSDRKVFDEPRMYHMSSQARNRVRNGNRECV